MSNPTDYDWKRFCRLGEMIGNGFHYEDKSISKEYNKLAEKLMPEIKQQRKDRKKALNNYRDEQMAILLSKNLCSCGEKYIQIRSGSLYAKCSCGKTVKASTKKR